MPAFAQDASEASVAPSSTSQPAEASTSGYEIEDIVVTAQKRGENLQKTAAAVTAITAEVIVAKGLSNITNVQYVVPSARFQQQSQNVQVFLRGVGANLDNPEIDPAVAVNLDGVYLPREGVGVALFDLAGIEVLPGPQGTLYGRNAIGGVVNMRVNRPKDTFEGSGLLEVGNYGLVHVTGVLNTPVSDSLAIRGAVNYTKRNGYMTNGADSQDDLAFRLGLLYSPSSDFSLYVWGLAAWNDGATVVAVNRGLDPNTLQPRNGAYLQKNPWNTNLPAQFAPFGNPGTGKGNVDYHNYVAGAELNAQITDDLQLTYIGSYLDLKANHSGGWITAIPTAYFAQYEQTTHELRLANDGTSLKWTAGLYGYRQINSGNNNFFVGFVPDQVFPGSPGEFSIVSVARNKIEGIAAFGQATYSLTDSLRATLGGRYSIDHRVGRGNAPFTGLPYSSDRTYRRFDYKVGGEYDLSRTAMMYLTYQTGYQPGTYNEAPSTPTFSNEVKPQTISAFTGGVKTRFLDNRLQINLEAFYYLYKNFFVLAADVNATFQPVFNAQKVEIPGFQLDVTARPTSLDQISFSAALTRARNKKFITPGGEDYSGLSPAYAADWTFIGSYGRDFEISSGVVHLEVAGRYETKRWVDYKHSFGVRQDPWFKVDASLTYRPESGGWSIGIWGKNLTDKATIAAAAPGGIPGPAAAYLEPPRTFGGRVTVNF